MLINKRIFPEKISMIELFLLWFWDANTIVGLLKPRRWSLCIYENRLLFSISFILNLKEARKTVNLSRGGPSGEAIAACLPLGFCLPLVFCLLLGFCLWISTVPSIIYSSSVNCLLFALFCLPLKTACLPLKFSWGGKNFMCAPPESFSRAAPEFVSPKK